MKVLCKWIFVPNYYSSEVFATVCIFLCFYCYNLFVCGSSLAKYMTLLHWEENDTPMSPPANVMKSKERSC